MNQKSAVRAFFALPPHLVELVRTSAGAFVYTSYDEETKQ